jgi:hypothetical protein
MLLNRFAVPWGLKFKFCLVADIRHFEGKARTYLVRDVSSTPHAQESSVTAIGDKSDNLDMPIA